MVCEGKNYSMVQVITASGSETFSN